MALGGGMQGVRAAHDVVRAARVARGRGADLQGRARGAGDWHALGVSSFFDATGNIALTPNSTWVLTCEDVIDPPIRLAEECKKAGIDDDIFTVCDIGQTVFF